MYLLTWARSGFVAASARRSSGGRRKTFHLDAFFDFCSAAYLTYSMTAKKLQATQTRRLRLQKMSQPLSTSHSTSHPTSRKRWRTPTLETSLSTTSPTPPMQRRAPAPVKPNQIYQRYSIHCQAPFLTTLTPHSPYSPSGNVSHVRQTVTISGPSGYSAP